MSPTGLYVVRELGRAGIPVIGVGHRLDPGRASRYLDDLIVDDDPRRLLELLLTRFAGHECRTVLLPTSDHYIEFVCDNAASLAEHFSFQASYHSGLARRILDKAQFYELCKACGLVYPCLIQAQADDLAALKDVVAYPCMIKPSVIHAIKDKMAGRKGWVARGQEQFDEIVRSIPKEAGTLLIQEVVPGPESNITLCCTYIDRAGTLRQSFTARKLRQYPPGFGSASLVRSCLEPEALEMTTTFLHSIGYRGIAAAEFKRDPRDGRLKIIEINTRPSLWFAVSSGSGKRLSLAAYHDLCGSETVLAENDQSSGVTWRYALKDAYSAVFYRLNSEFVLPPPNLEPIGAPGPNVYPVFSWDDPMPTLVEISGYAIKAPRQIVSKLASLRN
jgi:predicted ATP-grasp superfamily ATP-dependent carboligase